MRQRDILIASPMGANLATADALNPVYTAYDAAHKSLRTTAPMAGVRALRDLNSAMFEVLADITPDSPGKTFRACRRREADSPETAHAWKCRALELNPETTPRAALGGMTPLRTEDGWRLAVAYPAPCPVGPTFDDPCDLVLIDPKTGTASTEDGRPTLIEPAHGGRFTVHADARHWAREIATARMEFIHRYFAEVAIGNVKPVWIGAPPSALAIGSLAKIDWPFADFVTAGVGIDAKALVRILRRPSARVHAPINLRSGA